MLLQKTEKSADALHPGNSAVMFHSGTGNRKPLRFPRIRAGVLADAIAAFFPVRPPEPRSRRNPGRR